MAFRKKSVLKGVFIYKRKIELLLQEWKDQPKPNEWFNYDARGNIIQLQRYSDNRLIDDLHFSYQEDGNQLLSITDDGEDEHLHFEYRTGGARLGKGLNGRKDPNLIVDTKFESDPNNPSKVRYKED